MTEFVVDDQRYMVKVPKELRDVAVLLEPLTVAEKAAEQVRAWRRGCLANSRMIPATSAPSFSERGPSGCWAR